MSDITLKDLAEDAGVAATEASGSGGGSGSAAAAGGSDSTAEFFTEVVKTLEKRGLIEPMLFGPENAQKMQQTEQQPTTNDNDDAKEMSGLQLNAETVSTVGRGIMSTLGDDATLDDVVDEAQEAADGIKAQLGPEATVADVVQIAENNPAMINQQLDDLKDQL